MTSSRQPRRKGMDPEELERLYPSLSHLAGTPGRMAQRAWVAVFHERPDAMHALLADYIKQAHAQPGRIGQRPMPREEQVDLQGLLYGEVSEEPLVEVLPRLVKALRISERAMASKIHLSRTQYQRLLAGAYDPDVRELRAIAKAVGKAPTFFREYRAVMAVAAFINLIEERPGIATSLLRTHIEVRV